MSSALPRRFRLELLFSRSRVKALLHGWRKPEANAARRPDAASTRDGSRIGRLRRWRTGFLLRRLALQLGLRRPDIFHVQWLVARDQEWKLLLRLKRLKIPLVHTAHDLLPPGSDSAEDRAFFGRLYQLVDRVIVHTEQNRAELRGIRRRRRQRSP